MRLRGCVGSTEPLLLDDAIRIKSRVQSRRNMGGGAGDAPNNFLGARIAFDPPIIYLNSYIIAL